MTFDTSLSSDGGTSTTHPPESACSDTGDTSYAEFTSTKKEDRNYYYNFNVQGISPFSHIVSVQCVIKARSTATGTNYMGYTQLCVGTTGKGSETQINQINVDNPISLNTGTNWALSDFDSLNIRVSPNRGTNNRAIRFYGANLTINYTITWYSISTASSSEIATISSSSAETESGNSVTITVNVPDISSVIIKKDGTDITNQFTGSGGVYTFLLSNVNSDVSFTVEDIPSSNNVFLKSGNNWIPVVKAYQKTNGTWVEKTNIHAIFQQNNLYFKPQN